VAAVGLAGVRHLFELIADAIAAQAVRRAALAGLVKVAYFVVIACSDYRSAFFHYRIAGRFEGRVGQTFGVRRARTSERFNR
jgi:hypothetical protein